MSDENAHDRYAVEFKGACGATVLVGVREHGLRSLPLDALMARAFLPAARSAVECVRANKRDIRNASGRIVRQSDGAVVGFAECRDMADAVAVEAAFRALAEQARAA